MPGSEFPEIWPWRRERERMSDVKAALELFQRTRFTVQLSPRQDLWSLTLSKGEKKKKGRVWGRMFWDQRDFRMSPGLRRITWKAKNQDPANPPGDFCESISNISEVEPVSFSYSMILPRKADVLTQPLARVAVENPCGWRETYIPCARRSTNGNPLRHTTNLTSLVFFFFFFFNYYELTYSRFL